MPDVVDRQTWTRARREHLAEEKELTRRRDELSRRRRELPWTEIDAGYVFTGPGGEQRTLAELFDGRPQLIVQHFMFGAGWGEGCPSCSFWADGLDGTQIHLAHRNTTLVLVSRAPIEELKAYRERMGWTLPWWSSAGTTFNEDLGVGFTPEQVEAGTAAYNHGTTSFGGEEAPGISAFRLGDDGRVFLTYQTFARGLDMMNATYHYLDLTSMGRDEDDLPWSMAWLRRHDRYED
ncbi:MAG: DUF899 domain-containing protein [Actinomycetota bacterium]